MNRNKETPQETAKFKRISKDKDFICKQIPYTYDPATYGFYFNLVKRIMRLEAEVKNLNVFLDGNINFMKGIQFKKKSEDDDLNLTVEDKSIEV